MSSKDRKHVIQGIILTSSLWGQINVMLVPTFFHSFTARVSLPRQAPRVGS